MRFLLIYALLFLGLGAAVRLAGAEWAFRGGSPRQARQALRLLGSHPNAAYFERLADLAQDGQETFLLQALAANPRLTSTRIRLGLYLESRSETRRAESELLAAASYDRQYQPAWTLANFYFRHQDQPNFWLWSRTALSFEGQDPLALLRLADVAAPDEVTALHRLGGGEQLVYSYLDLLIAAGRLDAAQRVARVAVGARKVRPPQFLDLSTRQIRAGHIDWALEIWKALGFPLDPQRGPLLSRSLFATADGEGFHLRSQASPGVSQVWNPQGVSFTFDGREQDVCPLLTQPVPAPFGPIRYRLRYQFRASAEGTRWRMGDAESAVLPVSAAWQWGDWDIAVPPGESRDDRFRMLPLQLLYQRPSGALPAQGILELRDLDLKILGEKW